MRNFTFIALLTLIMFASCSKDDVQNNGTLVPGTETMVAIGFELPAENSLLKSSNQGGINNVDWNLYDLRYKIHIYDENGTNVIKRLDTCVNNANAFTKQTRLLAGKTYTFVVWADFVTKGTTVDLHYNTNDLANISIKAAAASYVINDESRDAYVVTKKETITASSISLTLKRPFAKVRVITEDLADVYTLADPATAVKTIKLSYENVIHNKFNALTGAVDNSDGYKPENIVGNVAEDDGTKATLFWDYIFTEDISKKINFNFTVNAIDVACEFNTNNVPIERNKLTTVRGNLLTNAVGITIDVDGNFLGQLDDDINSNLTITIPKSSVSPLSYKFRGNIANGVTINFVDEDSAFPYDGTISIIVDKATGAKFEANLAGAGGINNGATIVNLYGTIGDFTVIAKEVNIHGVVTGTLNATTWGNTLNIKQGAVVKDLNIIEGYADIAGSVTGNLVVNATTAVEVVITYGAVNVANINAGSNGKILWRVANTTELRSALAYPAAYNRGVVMAADCYYNAGTPGAGGNIDQQSAFIIAKSDAEQAIRDYTGYIFDGGGHTLSGSATNQVLICYTNDAIIRNVVITSNGLNMNGLTIHRSTGVKLNNVSSINNGKAGVIINTSEVIANKLSTSGNGWGGVNVDSKNIANAKFDFSDGTSTFAEKAKVWVDNVSAAMHTVTVPAGWTFSVNVRGQEMYHPIGEISPGAIVLNGESYATLGAAITKAVSGDIITIGAGIYDIATSTSLNINENLTIEGDGAVIRANTPATRSFSVTTTADYHGKNPVFYITGGNVTLKNLTISTNQTPTNTAVDGITITDGTLTLDGVTFDGIVGNAGYTGNQYGRCITALASSVITVNNCTFKNFNKNGIHMFDNSTANIDGCAFTGHGDAVSGNQVAAQNGVVFMGNTTTGSVENCTFNDFIHSGDGSCAVLLYNNTTSGSNITSNNNSFNNNNSNWSS